MARIELNSTSTVFAQKKDSPPGLWDPLAGLFKKKVPPALPTPEPAPMPEVIQASASEIVQSIPEPIQTIVNGVDSLPELIVPAEIDLVDTNSSIPLFENVEILPAEGFEQVIQNVSKEVIPEVLITPEAHITAAVTVLAPLENPTTLPISFTRKTYPLLTLRNFGYLAILVTVIAFIYFVYKNLWQKKSISSLEPKPILESSQTQTIPEIEPITTQEIQLLKEVVQEPPKSGRFRLLEGVVGGAIGSIIGFVLCKFFDPKKTNSFQQNIFRDAGFDHATQTRHFEQVISEKVKETTENAQYISKLTAALKIAPTHEFAEQIQTLNSNIQALQNEMNSLRQRDRSLSSDDLFERMDALEKSNQTLLKLREELQNYLCKEEYENENVSKENRLSNIDTEFRDVREQLRVLRVNLEKEKREEVSSRNDLIRQVQELSVKAKELAEEMSKIHSEMAEKISNSEYALKEFTTQEIHKLTTLIHELVPKIVNENLMKTDESLKQIEQSLRQNATESSANQKIQELENSVRAQPLQEGLSSKTELGFTQAIEEIRTEMKTLSDEMAKIAQRETSNAQKLSQSDAVIADLRSAINALSAQDFQKKFTEIEQSLSRLHLDSQELKEKRLKDLEAKFRESNKAIKDTQTLLEQTSKQNLKIQSDLEERLSDEHLKAKFKEILSKDKELTESLAKNQNLLASLNQGLLQAFINDVNFRLAFIGAVKDHPEFIKALSSGLATQLGSDQTLRESLIKDPNFITAILEKQELVQAISERPELLSILKEMINREVQIKLTELEKIDGTTVETSTVLKNQVELLQQAFTDFKSSANLEDLKKRLVATEDRLDGIQKSSLESNFEILSKIAFWETQLEKDESLIVDLMNMVGRDKLEIFKHMVQIQAENESTNNQLRMDYNNLVSKHQNLDQRFMRSGTALSSPSASPNQNRSNPAALSNMDLVQTLENDPRFKELVRRWTQSDKTPSFRSVSPGERNSSHDSKDESFLAFQRRITNESSPATGDYIKVVPTDVIRFLTGKGSYGQKYGLKEDQGSVFIRKDKVIQLHKDFLIAGEVTNKARTSVKQRHLVPPMANNAGLHPEAGERLLTESPSKQLILDSTLTPGRTRL